MSENKDKFDGIKVTIHPYNPETDRAIQNLEQTLRLLENLDRMDRLLGDPYSSLPLSVLNRLSINRYNSRPYSRFIRTSYPRIQYSRASISPRSIRRLLLETLDSQSQLRRTDRKININEEKYSSLHSTTDCSICKSEYNEGDIIADLKCCNNSIFHSDCIREWGRYKAECPLCRKSIDCVAENE